MKTFFLLTSLFCFLSVHSQDSLRIDKIDSLVSIIIHANLPTQRDSILQDYPAIGLKMKTYITVVTSGRQLKKYFQLVKTTRQENKIINSDVAGNAFYYDQNKLIKVEEFLITNTKENKMEWYFFNGKCIFHTSKSDKAEERSTLLLSVASNFLKKYQPL